MFPISRLFYSIYFLADVVFAPLPRYINQLIFLPRCPRDDLNHDVSSHLYFSSFPLDMA